MNRHRMLSAVILFVFLISSMTVTINAQNQVSISISTDKLGNNFFTDDMPKFNVEYSGDSGSYTAEVKVTDLKGNTISRFDENVDIDASGVKVQTLSLSDEVFGVCELSVTIGSTVAKTKFTLSNRSGNMPLNKRTGVSTHISRGRGTPDANFELISRAGIGNIRGEDFYWSSFETKEGEYSLTPMHKKLLSLISRYDMDYMFLCSSGNPLYKGKAEDPDIAPPSTPEGYHALENYISKLLELTDGKIKSVEVWNEYHNSDFSGGYNKNPQVHANLHRYIYNGVQSYNQKYNQDVSAVGFAEDWWGFGVTTAVADCLKELNGEKYFDYVSLHPYVEDFSKPFETDAQVKNLLSKADELLVVNGYSKNIPRIFSELGWDDYSLNYDQEKKAAYTVRAHAYVQANDLADIVYNYAFTDYLEYLETSPAQAGFGIVESYDSSRVEVPYLGKPVYVALSYWNNLMADNTFVKSIETDIENSYCYLFKDRYDRDIIMYGMLNDGETATRYMNLGVDYVTMADMYGNEQSKKSNDKIYKLNFTDKPSYIVGNMNGYKIEENYVPVEEHIAEQKGENKVEISGRLGTKSGAYTVRIYAKDRSHSDLSTLQNANNKDVLLYFDQGVTDKNGYYNKEFNISAKTDTYKVLIYSKLLDKEITPAPTLSFISYEDLAKAVNQLNGFASSNDLAGFTDCVNNNMQALGIDIIDDDGIEIAFNDVKKKPMGESDLNKSKELFARANIISELNHGRIADIFDYTECFETSAKDVNKYVRIQPALRTGITARIANKGIKDTDEFISYLRKATFLELAANPNGIENVIDALKDFSDIVSINPDKYGTDEFKEILNSVCGNSYGTIDEFVKAFKAVKISEPTYSGGGSSGGGGSSSGGGASVTVENSNLTQPSKEIGVDVFVDLDDVIWARNAIVTLCDMGVLNGKGGLNFCPNDLVLREEFTKMVVLAFLSDYADGEIQFEDVDKNEWYYPYILKAKGAEVINGYSDTFFGIGDSITREDLCKLVYNAYIKINGENSVKSELPFEDAGDIAEYARDAVEFMWLNNVVNGVDKTHFAPKAYATRAEAAKIIYGMLNLR